MVEFLLLTIVLLLLCVVALMIYVVQFFKRAVTLTGLAYGVYRAWCAFWRAL